MSLPRFTVRRFAGGLAVLAAAGLVAGWWAEHRRVELECGVCCPGVWRR